MRVRVVVRVDPEAGDRPPVGSDVVVELRDTSIADAASVVLATAHDRLPSADEPALEVELDVDETSIDPHATLTVFAQSIANVTRGRSKGDWITMAAYPALLAGPDEPLATEVTLRQIR